MQRKVLVLFALVVLVTMALTAFVRRVGMQGQKAYPKYCCTAEGVLGPYNNDSVPEGGACYGTKDGRRVEGKACYGEKKEDKKGYPKYCCTDAGKLGPYDNDSVPEGGACYGTKDGKRYEGTACY
jgi:hypothetical protein